jgi:hypothetical protein
MACTACSESSLLPTVQLHGLGEVLQCLGDCNECQVLLPRDGSCTVGGVCGNRAMVQSAAF